MCLALLCVHSPIFVPLWGAAYFGPPRLAVGCWRLCCKLVLLSACLVRAALPPRTRRQSLFFPLVGTCARGTAWDTAGVSPVLFTPLPREGDTHHYILRPDPRRRKTRARGPSPLTRSRGDLPFTGGTLCRSARGLSSARVIERGLRARSPCVCSVTCLGGAPPASVKDDEESEAWRVAISWPLAGQALLRVNP